MTNKEKLLTEEFLDWFKREGSHDYPNYIPEIAKFWLDKMEEREKEVVQEKLSSIEEKIGKLGPLQNYPETDSLVSLYKVLQIINEAKG